MRTFAILLVALISAQAHAQVPAPAPASRPAAEQQPAQAPLTAQQMRNWLLAHLFVDQNFDPQKVQAIQEGLADLNADQLDVLVRVYQQRRGQQETNEQAKLDQAQANLEQMKAYRNALSLDLDNLRAVRQAQYLNFGLYPGFGYDGLGYGRLGYSRFGYRQFGYGGYGPAAVGMPGPGYGFVGNGFPGGYGPAYGPGYPAYGSGYPGNGTGYPMNGGGNFGGGAGY